MNQKNHMAVLDLPQTLTRTDLEAILRVSRKTLAKMVANGELPDSVKVGQRDRWLVKDIVQFLESRTSNSKGAGGKRVEEEPR